MMAASGCENNGVADEKLRHCESVDSLSDWRSCEQVDNGTPSTSLPYWDISDDDDSGAKPSELHVRFTWKIENYSQTNKRELKSSVFEVGGYNWYILIYPQGCDAPHHLSLFLCVANHDKLLPGWSHFAQFTIAVLNKDPKKTKYSDTLHRFCKKEHDWGWKKFMELTRVSDGFVVADAMVVKAQVQVIREKAHRPFRCLDCEYRRELSKAYLSNVEQICRRFFEERRGKLSKLIEDKVKWSSFRAFWLGIDQNARRHMSRDKTDAILKITVKHFFIEKEVTSTLLMDFLYSGLKALEYQSKNKSGRKKLMEMEESLPPMVHVEKDMFVLADDVLLLLERVALDPLPYQPLPPKDDKCSQNRSKDGSSGDEFNKDSIERDERRLTELARRTLEIFILAHIFCKIEVAYQEAVALKRQEELIREEEAAENELKAKRGASEKEKRTKKKQVKQKRSSSKVKDRRRDEKSGAMMHEKHQEDIPSNERILGDLSSKQLQPVLGKIEAVEDVSDVSDNGNDHDEALQLDLEERDTSPVNWDIDTSEIHRVTETSSTDIQNRQNEKKSPSAMDDSSSTCSTDSVPSVVLNGPYKGNALPSNKSQTSPNRGKHQRKKDIHGRIHGGSNQASDVTAGASQLRDVTGSCSETRPESDAVHSMKNRIQWPEEHLVEKEEVLSVQKKLIVKDEIDVSKSRTEQCSTYISPAQVSSSFLHQRKQSSENTTATITEPASTQEISSIKVEKSVPLATSSLQTTSINVEKSISKSEALRYTEQTKSAVAQQTYVASRPLNDPLIPGPARAVPFASAVQTTPLLSRSVSAGGRLGLDPSPSQNYVPQSYRNAIMSKTTMGTSLTGLTHPSLSSSSQVVAYSQSPSAFVSSSLHLPRTPARKGQTSVKPGFSFGSVASDALHSPGHWIDDCSQQEASCSGPYSSHQVNGTMKLDSHDKLPSKYCLGEVSSSVSSQQAQGVMSDEFPHLDIINDLLEEEQNDGIPPRRYHHHSLNRQYTFPRDVATTTDIGPLDGSCQFDQPEQFFDGEFQRIYGSRSMAFNGLADVHPLQVDLSGYANGQVNGVFQQQWPFSSADFSMLSLGNADASGYSYQLPDYSTLSCGVSGYMYRPANGL